LFALPKKVFEEVRQADPASGARAVIRAHAADVLNVEVSDEGAFLDVDTPADYERYISSSR
jgi:CTP:molybdopterin cytidylyltransferase MocA